MVMMMTTMMMIVLFMMMTMIMKMMTKIMAMPVEKERKDCTGYVPAEYSACTAIFISMLV
eukprot:4226047-Karenia_brevis.AAC.1